MGLHIPPTRAKHTWCGPYAVAAATGVAVEVVEEKINERRLKPPTASIGKASANELHAVLSELGYKKASMIVGSGLKDRSPSGTSLPTLAAWLKRRRGDEMKMTYIVLITGHFVAVRGRKITCSQTREVRFLKSAPGRRMRVRCVINIGERTKAPI